MSSTGFNEVNKYSFSSIKKNQNLARFYIKIYSEPKKVFKKTYL